jgi:hypothetical protein
MIWVPWMRVISEDMDSVISLGGRFQYTLVTSRWGSWDRNDFKYPTAAFGLSMLYGKLA